MEITMDYMAKIDKEDFNKWKKNNKEFNGRLMFQIWVNELSDEKKFDKFMKTVKPKHEERKKETSRFYRLVDLNVENWKKFLENCKKNNMYGNDMVNILVKRFNDEGYCIEAKIKV